MNRTAAILIIVLLGAPLAGRAQDVVAKVDGESIETNSFERQYKEYLARTGTADAPRLRSAVLAQMINDRLIIADGRRSRLNKSPEFRLYEASARKKLLVESYLSKHVVDAVHVTDDDVEGAFVRINTEIEARHLFARTREEADRIYDRLIAGESFENLAREVFADPALAENGGSIGSFTFDELDADFEDAAFGLAVGEISQPVRTAHGYSIIQVQDRFTKPILTELEFARRKDKLRAFVLGKKQQQARSHFVRSQAEQLRPVFHAGFDRLFGQITGVTLVEDEAMGEFLNEPLISFDRVGDGREDNDNNRTSAGDRSPVTWTIADFRVHAALTPAEHRAQVRTEADLRDFVTALVVRANIVAAAEELRLDDRPDYAKALSDAADAWILERQKESVIDGVDVPEDSIRAHYDRSPAEFTNEEGIALGFDEARNRIADQLHRAYASRAMLEFIASLRRDADVKVNETALRGVDIPGRASSPAGSTSMQTSEDRAASSR